MELLRPLIVMLGIGQPSTVLACDLALALTVDVSGSISPGEYRLQMDGLSDALLDPTVADALISGQVALSLVQWTGEGRQAVSLPWTSVTSQNVLQEFSDAARTTPRRWRHFSTAIGDALAFTAAYFTDAPACARRVIDVSGDGENNEGLDLARGRDLTLARQITINALAIETSAEGLGDYFRTHLIGGPGSFVLTARDFEDYPRAIRRKLLNEVVKPAS